MGFEGDIRQALIARTFRVPAPAGDAGDGRATARQLDIALLSVGFKCSGELLEHLSGLHPVVVRDAGERVLRAVRELVGDHVRHNAYFVRFPEGVPDTIEFWAGCIADALLDPRSAGNVATQLASGTVNLLDLPRYGRYQHTYEELLAAHDDLIPAAKDRLNVLALGRSFAQESRSLYHALAASPVPLSEDDLALLDALAALHVTDELPEEIPIRENRAVVNKARALNDLPLLVDTPVDVLRAACALADGDVTLTAPTRFGSLPRPVRRRLISALDSVVRGNPGKLADLGRHAEAFKRLGERLHPHEHPRHEAAQDAFAVVRGERTVRSLAGKVELALADDDVPAALALLAAAPGTLLRSVDRLARAGADDGLLAEAVREAAPAVSSRVLLSVREHLLNRGSTTLRIFVNQQGGSWVEPDERPPLPEATLHALQQALDEELTGRLARSRRWILDPALRTIALPLSGKSKPGGLGILPRGSVSPVERAVRFFVHWKQHARMTDYDLSVLLLDEAFSSIGQVSWTNLRDHGIVHSGDVTEAPDGASEFVDLDLSQQDAHFVVPQVNVYSGESFDRADEAFFGFMEREPGRRGRPFEPRTVRTKSDLVGRGRVSLPIVFARGPGGAWHAKWMHLNLSGRPRFNRVETNQRSTSALVRGIIERRYLTIGYLEALLRAGGATVDEWPATVDAGEPFTYLGLERPEDLPPGADVYTPATLSELFSPT